MGYNQRRSNVYVLHEQESLSYKCIIKGTEHYIRNS